MLLDGKDIIVEEVGAASVGLPPSDSLERACEC